MNTKLLMPIVAALLNLTTAHAQTVTHGARFQTSAMNPAPPPRVTVTQEAQTMLPATQLFSPLVIPTPKKPPEWDPYPSMGGGGNN